jgi:SulP family sulfate permease
VRIARFLPFLNWPRLSRELLAGELQAGLTVGLMVIPQGVAYAALAGMPLITGIYASLLPALIAVLFSSSVRLSVGPTALSCLLISASLAGLADPGSGDWVNLVIWLALMSGGLQVFLGAIRFGWLLNIVTAPVLMAFTQAAAVLIIGSQLRDLVGIGELRSLGSALQQWDHSAAAFGLGALVTLALSRHWKPAFPTVLVVVLASAALSLWYGFAERGGRVVGFLPQGMPVFQMPHWPGLAVLGELLVPAFVITAISFLETAASAKVDNAQRGTGWDQDQDLIGQGLSKLAAGFSGAFPTSSSFSRSALNLYAGARSGWATVFSVVVVGLALQWFLPILYHVPKAVLAAIVLVAVVGLIRPREFISLWRVSRAESVIAFVTFAVTVIAAPDLYWGVLVGVILALSHFMYWRMHPRIIEVGLHADGRLRGRKEWNLPAIHTQTYIVRMDAALDFGSAAALEHAISDHLALAPHTRNVVLLASGINRIDATGVVVFSRLRRQLAQQRRVLMIVGLKLPVQRAIESAGDLSEGPYFSVVAKESEAIDMIKYVAES